MWRGALFKGLLGHGSPQPSVDLQILLRKASLLSFSSEIENCSLNSLLGRSFIFSSPESLFAFLSSHLLLNEYIRPQSILLPDSKINYIMSRNEGCWKLLMYLLGTLCIPIAFTWVHGWWTQPNESGWCGAKSMVTHGPLQATVCSFKSTVMVLLNYYHNVC